MSATGWRQYDGTTQEGGQHPRRPFMKNAWPVHEWNRADVQVRLLLGRSYTFNSNLLYLLRGPLVVNVCGAQSVGGGFVVMNDTLRFYSSGSKDLPFGQKTAHYHSRGNKSTGMAWLRRDGFTSVQPTYSISLPTEKRAHDSINEPTESESIRVFMCAGRNVACGARGTDHASDCLEPAAEVSMG